MISFLILSMSNEDLEHLGGCLWHRLPTYLPREMQNMLLYRLRAWISLSRRTVPRREKKGKKKKRIHVSFERGEYPPYCERWLTLVVDRLGGYQADQAKQEPATKFLHLYDLG